MKKKDALALVKGCAKDKERAGKSGMEFRPHPQTRWDLNEACPLVANMRHAPAYAKRFAYSEIGGDYDSGYLPSWPPEDAD